MKKLLALILTLVIALPLTACGGETEEEPAPEDENPATEEDAGGEDRVFRLASAPVRSLLPGRPIAMT